MPRRKGSLAAIGLIAATVAVIFVVMWAVGIGFFSAGEHTAIATTTTATPTVKIQSFNPANETESQAYFASLWASTKATEAEIKRQERVVKLDPSSVDNQTALVGLKQNCISIVASYDAAALAIASNAFRSVGLPPQVSPKECSP